MCVITVFSFASCRSDEDDPFKKVKTTTTAVSDYKKTSPKKSPFKWNKDRITGLTEEGENEENLTVPKKCKVIDANVFAKAKAKTVTFEGKNVNLNNSFTGAKSIKAVVLPKGQKEIKSGEFAGCTNLETINIPNDTIVEDNAFKGDTALKNIIVTKSNSNEPSKINSSDFPDSPGKNNIHYNSDTPTTSKRSESATIKVTESTTRKNYTDNPSQKPQKDNHVEDKTTENKVTTTHRTVTPPQHNSVDEKALDVLQRIESEKDLNGRIAEYIEADDSSNALKRIKY